LKKKATRLCDINVGIWAGHPPEGETKSYLTCDNQMCDDCTLVFRNMDICPKCQKQLKEKLEV
jgi:hypothetical protein